MNSGDILKILEDLGRYERTSWFSKARIYQIAKARELPAKHRLEWDPKHHKPYYQHDIDWILSKLVAEGEIKNQKGYGLYQVDWNNQGRQIREGMRQAAEEREQRRVASLPETILGVRSGATEEEVKRAFREKIKTVPPGLNQTPEEKARFEALVNARDKLLKPVKPAGFFGDFWSDPFWKTKW